MNIPSEDVDHITYLSEIYIHHDDTSSFLTVKELISKDNPFYMCTSHQTRNISIGCLAKKHSSW